LIDINIDKEQSKAWLEDGRDGLMHRQELISLAITGIETCEGYCGSREVCGESSCLCVRAMFPTPSHFFLYQELRKVAQTITSVSVLAETINNDEYRDD
jgi:hypothetical protein